MTFHGPTKLVFEKYKQESRDTASKTPLALHTFEIKARLLKRLSPPIYSRAIRQSSMLT